MPFLANLTIANSPMAQQTPEQVLANFEELSLLESEFDDVELELSMTRPL